MSNCVNCNHPIDGSYCSNCGQPFQVKRIDKHYISHELLHLLHFEKGFFYTLKELMLLPGKSIRTFIEKDRSKHMKPVSFLLLTSLLFTLVAHSFHADEIYNQKDNLSFGKSSISDIMNWVKTHWGYVNVILGLFITFCLKLFFGKYKFNYFELMVLMCFVMGQAMLLLTVITLFYPILGNQNYVVVSSLVSFGYTIWAMAQFFDGSKIWNYFKSFTAYFLGYLLFYVSIIPVGIVSDIIIRLFFKAH